MSRRFFARTGVRHGDAKETARYRSHGVVPTSGYLWCFRCERTYPAGSFRQEGDQEMCPYDGCVGDAVIDARDWESVVKENPDYPDEPEVGMIYPLYGPNRPLQKEPA